jgi:ElaB/YqjD/DUF883 family membrane-anchored ribosome-binding protein
MTIFHSAEHANSLTDQAALTADSAIKSTQRVANEALDSLAGTVQDMRHTAARFLNPAADQASAFAHRGIDAVRERSQQMREKAQHASDNTLNYIKEEPVKAMLIAAATGAVVMAVVGWLNRPNGR